MEDLQGLLEKINRDGIEKADAEAKKIIAAAMAKADSIVKNACAEAERAKAEAEKASAAYAERAAETIRQSARDLIIAVKDSLTSLLEGLLAKDVDKALADETTVAKLVTEAIEDLSGPGEIKCAEKLAAALKARLAGLGSFSLDVGETTGFTVKLDGGRIEHSFTGEVIAAELARRLRPDLAKLLNRS